MPISLEDIMLRSKTARDNAPDNFTRPADVLWYGPTHITTAEELQADPYALYNTPNFGKTSLALLAMGLLDEVVRLNHVLAAVDAAIKALPETPRVNTEPGA
jgi:hypothetical protein